MKLSRNLSVHSLVLSVHSIIFLTLINIARADTMDSYRIGEHGTANIKYPDWFKHSFLDLREDLNEARESGKRGIIIFFSQKNCSHCQAFLDTTLNNPDIRDRVRKEYDVIGLDIFNDIDVTDVNGTSISIASFAEAEKARLTPTLIFFGVDNTRILRIIGFYPPEKFTRVLDYIASEQYKKKTLSSYLRSQTATTTTGSVQKVEYNYRLFSRPPHDLNRQVGHARKPLLVLFDQANCAPCRRFQNRVLGDIEVKQLLKHFDAVQLDINDNSSILTDTTGRKLTPNQWATELDLAYEPAVIFFDTEGREVHRLDSETGKDRMTGSMQYVLEKAYNNHQQFLRWRREKSIQSKVSDQ